MYRKVVRLSTEQRSLPQWPQSPWTESVAPEEETIFPKSLVPRIVVLGRTWSCRPTLVLVRQGQLGYWSLVELVEDTTVVVFLLESGYSYQG